MQKNENLTLFYILHAFGYEIPRSCGYKILQMAKKIYFICTFGFFVVSLQPK